MTILVAHLWIALALGADEKPTIDTNNEKRIRYTGNRGASTTVVRPHAIFDKKCIRRADVI